MAIAIITGYRRHEPEKTVLYHVVREHLDAFLASCSVRGGLPRFVEREFEAFLDCGILSQGFARLRCGRCGADLVVGFSCKGRDFCPSCAARRMSDTAAHLVERVIPRVPVRQWVLTLPYTLRYLIANRRPLARAVRRIFARAVLGFLRRLGVRQDLGGGQSGTVTFVQRFDSALRLNVHFHLLALDGAGWGYPFRSPRSRRQPSLSRATLRRDKALDNPSVGPVHVATPRPGASLDHAHPFVLPIRLGGAGIVEFGPPEGWWWLGSGLTDLSQKRTVPKHCASRNTPLQRLTLASSP